MSSVGPTQTGGAGAADFNYADEDASVQRLEDVAAGKVELGFGAKGVDVCEIQKWLVKQGLLPEGSADGVFGRKTEAAISTFQKAHGLCASGRLDAATTRAMSDVEDGVDDG